MSGLDYLNGQIDGFNTRQRVLSDRGTLNATLRMYV